MTSPASIMGLGTQPRRWTGDVNLEIIPRGEVSGQRSHRANHTDMGQYMRPTFTRPVSKPSGSTTDEPVTPFRPQTGGNRGTSAEDKQFRVSRKPWSTGVGGVHEVDHAC